jgi:ADP-heptose:LPS heptosyltransferase
MILKNDCRYFPGDRPCRYHKEQAIVCDKCSYYSPVKHKILIIKLDATGDVLRTTSVLNSLAKKYNGTCIYWLTKKYSKDLFINNNLVAEVLVYEEPASVYRLSIDEFDIVINLDPSPVSSALAASAKGKQKFGFGLNEKGKVFPFNKDAEEWFEMGAFDFLKQRNVKTYQKIIHEICGLDYNKEEIILNLSDSEKLYAENFKRTFSDKKFSYIVGINAGASDRWQFKKWRTEGYKELIKKLIIDLNCLVLLYGGPEEKDINSEFSKLSNFVVDTGSENSLRNFIALMNIPDILITGDTLALHVATALKKKVICLFGPTSFNEIEDYGRITKVFPKLECLVCYKERCSISPNCMDLISSGEVFNLSKKLLTDK